jgi:BirA family biotin operon repressor/biotin-[acetyl-CoA-carboxylase] ligase
MRAPLFATSEALDRFRTTLATRAVGQRIDFHARAQSTNTLALDAARAGAPHGTVVVADWQDAGRGRRGRTWECVPAAGLLCSVLVRPARIPVRDSGWIPLLAGLSCIEALEELAPSCGAALKWPNDIVIPAPAPPGWRKLGGILCEAALATDSAPGHVVIGIGLNLDQSAAELPPTAKAPPTSLRLETGLDIERQSVFKALLEALERNLLRAENPGDFARLRTAIEARLRAWWSDDTRLRYVHPGTEHATEAVAVFAGLDEFGRIRLRGEDGERVSADAEIVGVSRS